ncbi:MAG: uroporphyrinogen decarboxylase family protein [Promethearchaeota archaeon]
MKGKERVKRALNFDKPDRIPKYKLLFGDVISLNNLPPKSWQPNERGVYPHSANELLRKLRLYRWKRPDWAPKDWWKHEREEIDEWGCYWNKTENDLTMGHPGRPAIDTWDKLETWEGPDAANPKVYSFTNALSKIFFRRYKTGVVHDFIYIMNRVSMLRGFSNLLIDHRRNPEKVHQLTKKVADVFMSNVEMLITKFSPDAIWACDDLGTQHDLFFSPETFKKFYAGPYKRIITYCHDHDCAFHLHSCGNIRELIPILIDIGVDSLEFDSPRMTEFEELSKFRGKFPFWACVNIQSIYPYGTPEDVEQEVKQMIQTFSTQDGGYLAFFYPDTNVINVPKRNVKAFKRALKKWGKYPLNWIT